MRKGRVTGLPVSGWIDELTTLECQCGACRRVHGRREAGNDGWQVWLQETQRSWKHFPNESCVPAHRAFLLLVPLLVLLTLLGTVKPLPLIRVDPVSRLASGLDGSIVAGDIRLGLGELGCRSEEGERRGGAVKVAEAATCEEERGSVELQKGGHEG